ncbi:hypothetical protein [Fictibacillus enclensis]|uniref:hypothetical protein n=1 Tax=Fictibacillus enclensis TaxID=1017270 RepID=UPI0024C00D90|nr:hypothetical protein [Fictibacillus enclensis]WHY72132.1 hypothetical protein QNH15_24610 [Fictibacillus enclensis]
MRIFKDWLLFRIILMIAFIIIGVKEYPSARSFFMFGVVAIGIISFFFSAPPPSKRDKTVGWILGIIMFFVVVISGLLAN